jgi:hypothetical protein
MTAGFTRGMFVVKALEPQSVEVAPSVEFHPLFMEF